MRLGLTPRILFAGGLVVVLLVIEFTLLALWFRTVGATTAREERAEQSIVAATQVETLVVDLETGMRGYVITHDPRFLEPWRSARTRLPSVSARLGELAPGPRTAAIAAAWRAYVRDYSIPTVNLVRTDPRAARIKVASSEGKRRVDGIRALIDPFVSDRSAAAAADRATVARVRRQGRAAAVLGSILAILGVAAFMAFVQRVLVTPLRRTVTATREVAAGRPVALSENAPGEVGQLAVAFNEMSRSLERSQGSLAEQNFDLERLANQLRAVLDATVDGILLSDREGGVQLANRPMLTLSQELGMTLGTNVIDNLLSIADQMTDREAYRVAMERLRTTPDESTMNEFEFAATGRVFQGFTAQVHDLDGGFAGRIWTLREMTHERELDRLKSDFVATVSHELRTPLTSMMGFLEMIRDGEAGELTADQQRFLAIVYRSSERLQRLVGDLLFVARLDANGLQLQFGEVQLDEIVDEVVESMAALARARALELSVDIQPLPVLRGDGNRIEQVVTNLLSNAIKFTPAGGRVAVRTFVEDGQAVLEVEDSGIGIPDDEQERLFERFFRSTTATAQAIPGTGLGLVIAKAITEAHGGRIGVHSEAGAGACFRVELPLLVADASGTPTVPA